MVRFALVVSLVGCVGSASRTPAWPKLHESDTDGGESLAPHAAAAAVMAAAGPEDDKPIIPVVVAPTAATPTATPTVTPTVAPSTDETIQTEEIIIEIDD
jgi:hypothetical protein